MPVVTVQMWTGRTPAQKRALCRAITDAMVQHAGAKPTNLHVILQEVPKENWALAGVMGDERTYENVLAVRAVTTTDFMTADWYRMPHDLMDRIARRVVNEVRGVNRVVYDISSKPPSTIEWE